MPRDNQEELFYWVDQEDNVLGSVRRGETYHKPFKIHRAVQIVLMNDRKQTLLQKRSSNKDTFPGYWTVSASGHVTYGQEYAATAHRELKEEIGFDTDKLTYEGKIFVAMQREQEFNAIFTGQCDYALPDFTIDPTEVSEVCWVNLDQLREFTLKNSVTSIAIQTYSFLKLI